MDFPADTVSQLPETMNRNIDIVSSAEKTLDTSNTMFLVLTGGRMPKGSVLTVWKNRLGLPSCWEVYCHLFEVLSLACTYVHQAT